MSEPSGGGMYRWRKGLTPPAAAGGEDALAITESAVFPQPVSTNPQITLAATEAPDTAAFTLGVRQRVSLAATEAPDVASFTVGLRQRITLAGVEASDTASFSLTAVSSSSTITLAATEGPDTAAFAVGLRQRVALTATEAPDIAAFAIGSRARITLGATEAPDVAAFSLSALSGSAQIVLSASEAPDTASFQLQQNLPAQGGGAPPLRWLPNFRRLRKEKVTEKAEEAPAQKAQVEKEVPPQVVQKLEQEEKAQESELRRQVVQGDAIAAFAVEALIAQAERNALLAEQLAQQAAIEDEEMQAIALILSLVD